MLFESSNPLISMNQRILAMLLPEHSHPIEPTNLDNDNYVNDLMPSYTLDDL